MNIDSVLPWLLFAWLVIETVWDLRSHDVPVWFSLVMLIPGLALVGLFSPWGAVVIVLSLLATEVVKRSPLSGVIGASLLAITLPLVRLIAPAYLPLFVGWGGLMVIWLIGVIGGADALAGLSLLLFFPSWIMLACIVAGILIWSVALLIFRYGRSAGLRLWTVASTRAAGTRAAGIGAYALAALIFGVLEWFH